MNVASEKVSLIQWITELKDTAVIGQLKLIREQLSVIEKKYASKSLAEIDSIDRGLSDIENGKIHPHASAEKRFKKWLND